jgi:hypothetical protein
MSDYDEALRRLSPDEFRKQYEGTWECSWISSGDRFVGVARSPALAAARCYEAMVAAKRDHSGDRLPQEG